MQSNNEREILKAAIPVGAGSGVLDPNCNETKPYKMGKKEYKAEFVFAALSEMENIQKNIYGDILTFFCQKFTKVHVICLGKRKDVSVGNIIYHCAPLTTWPRLLDDFLDKNKTELALITDFFVGGWLTTRAARKKNIPVVYRCGGPWKYPLSPLGLCKTAVISLTRPYVIKNCRHVVYNSKAIVLPYPHDYSVIYNGVDTSLFTPRKDGYKMQEGRKLRLLFVGRVFQQKGLSYLFEALRGLKEKINLSIVGDGPLLNQYRKAEAGVRFYGDVAKRDIPKMIQQHDVLILPSLVESFPNVLLEAMACGLPVIATNIFGIPEMIEEGVNGFLVPPKNSTALRAAIERYLKEPELVSKMGKKAREVVLQRFSYQRQMTKLFEKIFKK